MTRSLLRFLALAVPLCSVAGESWAAEVQTTSAVTDIRLSFKRDPRVVDPYRGVKPWSDGPGYTGATAQDTVEARALALDGKGTPTKIAPKWVASDPKFVTVTPEQGNDVKIVVKGAGESKLKISANEVSKELVIKAKYVGRFIVVDIAPLGRPKPRTPAPAKKEAPVTHTRTEKGTDGMVALPSGLKYKVLKAGDGQKPKDNDVVDCRYRLSSATGNPLEGADGKSQERTFSVSEASWKEALKLMPVGSKWQIFVPGRPVSRGDRPRGRKRSRTGFSMPYVLELELLAIRAPQSASAGQAARN